MTAQVELDSPAGTLARALATELGRYGIRSQVSECEGIALVGIWTVGLVVWCECGPHGWHFRWCRDNTSARWTYIVCPCSAMETAVQRLLRFYSERHKLLHGTTPVIGDNDMT